MNFGRWRTISALAGTAIVVSGFWLLAGVLHKPGDTAAAVKPTVLTAPVEERVLTTSAVTRGTLAAPSLVSPGCLPVPVNARQVITVPPPAMGSAIAEGARLLEVSGRPVFVLQGMTPLYRDLTPGEIGQDVTELQSALARLGYSTSDRPGYYGASTSSAVARFFADRGYSATPPPDSVVAAAAQATATAAQAKTAEATAAAALTAAQAGPDALTLRTANLQIDAATVALQQAQQAADQPPPGSDSATLQLAVEQQQLALDRAKAALATLVHPDLSGLQAAVASTSKASSAADLDLARAQQVAGVSVGQCEVLVVPDFPATVTAPSGSTTTPSPGATPNSATDSTDANSTPDSASQSPSTTAIPIALASGEPEITASITGVAKDRLQTGLVADLTDDATGEHVPGTVASVQSSADSGDTTVTLVIKPDPAVASAHGLVGKDLRITLPTQSTDQQTLVVPASAIVVGSDGAAKVLRVLPDARIEPVAVHTGLSSNGYVAVSGNLRKGDDVVISS